MARRLCDDATDEALPMTLALLRLLALYGMASELGTQFFFLDQRALPCREVEKSRLNHSLFFTPSRTLALLYSSVSCRTKFFFSRRWLKLAFFPLIIVMKPSSLQPLTVPKIFRL
jgi:hypothetical protein